MSLNSVYLALKTPEGVRNMWLWESLAFMLKTYVQSVFGESGAKNSFTRGKIMSYF
jgi:hypothetical protein